MIKMSGSQDVSVPDVLDRRFYVYLLLNTRIFIVLAHKSSLTTKLTLTVFEKHIKEFDIKFCLFQLVTCKNAMQGGLIDDCVLLN